MSEILQCQMTHAIHRVERFEIVGPYTLALRFEDGTSNETTSGLFWTASCQRGGVGHQRIGNVWLGGGQNMRASSFLTRSPMS